MISFSNKVNSFKIIGNFPFWISNRCKKCILKKSQSVTARHAWKAVKWAANAQSSSTSCDLPATLCVCVRSWCYLNLLVFQFTMQVLEKQVNYRTQLQHLHSSQVYLQSSTSFEVQYNDHVPFVAGLQWRDASRSGLKKWEGEVPQTISSLWLEKQALKAAAGILWGSFVCVAES